RTEGLPGTLTLDASRRAVDVASRVRSRRVAIWRRSPEQETRSTHVEAKRLRRDGRRAAVGSLASILHCSRRPLSSPRRRRIAPRRRHFGEIAGWSGGPRKVVLRPMKSLLEKITSKTAHVVVMGIGYVGLPLVAEFARSGFRVTGLDPDPRKVSALRAGRSFIDDVPTSDLAPHVAAGRLDATTDPEILAQADAVVICVPTPLNKTKDPDMQFIVAAADEIQAHQHPGMLVILESTTYPGTTSEVLLPRLAGDRFQIGQDVFVAFSPERVDPGNTVYKTRNTPKVIGGATPECLELATSLYAHIIDHLVPVSSPETAEMVKLLENTFRAVNIGLVNEVAIMSR